MDYGHEGDKIDTFRVSPYEKESYLACPHLV